VYFIPAGNPALLTRIPNPEPQTLNPEHQNPEPTPKQKDMSGAAVPHSFRADLAQIRQSMPNYDLHFQVKALKPFTVDAFSLGSGAV
jgi:hypothetical protein